MRLDYLSNWIEEKFVQRGYPVPLLKKQRSVVEQNDMRAVHSSSDKVKRVPFVSKYTSLSEKVAQIILKHWGILMDGIPSVEIFKEPPFMYYKRNKTKGSMLVRSDVTPQE
ncbi:hypothetical protein XELAEV_18021524mg [Xenopus laevis]|uniref:Uncharacterized protein n=1 Tax=Xenopus laevis TaxID=8355 RepID=A0A974DBD6_XENLA|nr:hypothetical protein XELAEV_18021524mg [Xenopus laevis]